MSDAERLRWIELVARAAVILAQKAKYQYEYYEWVRNCTRGIQWMASMPDKWIQDNRQELDEIHYRAADAVKAHETSAM